MTLQSSGTISLSDIRDEYNNGSSAPIDIDDYYRGGSLVRANASNNTSMSGQVKRIIPPGLSFL